MKTEAANIENTTNKAVNAKNNTTIENEKTQNTTNEMEKTQNTTSKTDNAQKNKEERAKDWKEYYDWLKSVYPKESIELTCENGETLQFYHGAASKFEYDENFLCYLLLDKEFIEYLNKMKELNLRGEEMPNDEKVNSKSKGFFSINKNKKNFNFGIDWDYQGNGYGKTIYNNYLKILEDLGIEDKEQYELRIQGGKEHDFFRKMDTRKLIARVSKLKNTQEASAFLEEFAKYPNEMKFSELNTIIESVKNLNVPVEDIAKAINDNGFNICYSTNDLMPIFRKEDVEKFKSFGITGINLNCMHKHFLQDQNFGFLELLDDVDMDDATLEFKNIFDEVKRDYAERKKKGSYINPNLEKFGELEHIILDWKYSGLLFKNVNPEIQSLVKEQAISKFDEFDPEHNYSWGGFRLDSKSAATFEMLRDSGLMDKDAYIELYQKALNRNYNLDEFDEVIYNFIDSEQRKLAREEIAQNVYYPAPKGKWQKLNIYGENHRIPKVEIPQSVIQKGNVRDILKQEILNQGVARKTKIKTDMIGIGKDGKPFVVDNLKDWLFGVPGAHGNLQIIGTTAVVFPPQTPKFAVDLVTQALKNIEYTDIEECK